MQRLHLTVRAVTQQWAKPLSEIPHGWKTIAKGGAIPG
jgi:hypothetical protein